MDGAVQGERIDPLKTEAGGLSTPTVRQYPDGSSDPWHGVCFKNLF